MNNPILQLIKFSSKKPTRKTFFSLLFFAVVVMSGFFLYAGSSSAYGLLDRLNILPKRENYTELYFVNHLALPKRVPANGIISFSFSVHSLEGRDTEYPYLVYFVSSNVSVTTIDKGSLKLKDGEHKTIEEKFALVSPAKKGTMFVELLGRNQKIDFHLSNLINP